MWVSQIGRDGITGAKDGLPCPSGSGFRFSGAMRKWNSKLPPSLRKSKSNPSSRLPSTSLSTPFPNFSTRRSAWASVRTPVLDGLVGVLADRVAERPLEPVDRLALVLREVGERLAVSQRLADCGLGHAEIVGRRLQEIGAGECAWENASLERPQRSRPEPLPGKAELEPEVPALLDELVHGVRELLDEAVGLPLR
jgi:hypothetical protein